MAGTGLAGEGAIRKVFPTELDKKFIRRATMPLAHLAFDDKMLVNHVAQHENSMGSSQIVCQHLEGRDRTSGNIPSHPGKLFPVPIAG